MYDELRHAIARLVCDGECDFLAHKQLAEFERINVVEDFNARSCGKLVQEAHAFG